jgi:ABC-type phosphate transport system substrate-binding protein
VLPSFLVIIRLRRFVFAAALLAGALGLALGRGPAEARAQSTPGSRPAFVSIIAHPDVPLDAIDRNDLRDYFSRDKRRWDDGTPIVLLDYAGPPEVREAFYDFLGRSSSRMRTLWLRQRLSGEGDTPAVYRDAGELVRYVAATPGALSFVATRHADGSVKTLGRIRIEDD